MEIEEAYLSLAAWCRAKHYAGYDPFDGLNSRIFQATPLRRTRAARLIWTQVFKRSPINLRPLARVSVGKNAKGIALFALAALSRFRRLRTEEANTEARSLLNELLSMRLDGWRGAAWGYNFDWQGRAFFAPRGTPTIVPTAFAARALLEAWEIFGEERYRDAARGACQFILRDLNRSVETEDEICFSYSPLDHTRVFNASLLAAETLACVGRLTNEDELREKGLFAVNYVVRRQRADGSWAYGADDYQSWADNFHTAFVLASLARIIRIGKGKQEELRQAVERGYQFWRRRFFLADGLPKYYHDKPYPADAHSAGAALVTFAEMQELNGRADDFAEQVARWAIVHLRDERGFFWYQRKRFYTVRIPYMRWSQAWMLYGLAKFIEGKSKN
ncbi:MAG: delta-aminolevulinic acid dehydratase [Pyrinomonadaceae bacterium]|nr:delta-aminolevulinic acid dehydratase [Pyrinomonadaceae bacterium]